MKAPGLKPSSRHDRDCYIVTPHSAYSPNGDCWTCKVQDNPDFGKFCDWQRCDGQYIRTHYIGDGDFKLRRHWKRLGTYQT